VIPAAGDPARLKLKAQVLVGEEIAMGPGKADLLDAIAAHGSISAAARSMGLSYRRAWLMVDAMNRLFGQPLVATSAGARGGATITPEGVRVLGIYRQLQAGVENAGRELGDQLLGKLA
jgi:molybdate transport system regulatory protein